eukprot:scpid96665/ scgid32678/ Protein CutA; Acetylcholinesterase-associated protein; Brain acetylcholinesterase putative membrane anchor
MFRRTSSKGVAVLLVVRAVSCRSVASSTQSSTRTVHTSSNRCERRTWGALNSLPYFLLGLTRPSSTTSMASGSGEEFRPGMVLTTTDSLVKAKELAQALVESRLAACVQMKEITSVYRWDGATQMDPEYQLVIKCNLNRYDAVEKFLLKKHNYDCPQIVAVEIACGSPEYLDFMRKETEEGSV